MSDLYWPTAEQIAKLSPFFPKSHGKLRVDDRRVLSGIIFTIAMACVGEMLLPPMVRIRRSTAGGRGGARKASSPG